MKKLRNYRIKLKESDNVICTLYEIVGDSLSNSHRVSLDNISTTGVGVLIDEFLDSQKVFKIELKYKKSTVHSTVKLRRFRPNHDKSGKYYMGLEYIEYNIDSVMNLMTELVSSMSKRRLKMLMYDMVLNEAIVGSIGHDTEIQSTPMILDLFNIFKDFKDKTTLISLFIFEVKRVLKARDARIFSLESDEQTFIEYDFQTHQYGEMQYPNIGILRDMHSSPHGVKSKFSQTLCNDEFFNMYEVVNNVSISTYIMCPIFDQNENLYGVLNFSNKENGELFSDSDLKHAMFLSRLIGLLYFHSTHSEVEEFGEDDFDSPLGRGSYATKAKEFISSQAILPTPVYIYGPEGSGKSTICTQIIKESHDKRNSVYSINCYSTMGPEDLKKEIHRIEKHTLNGNIIFKNFDDLPDESMRYILEEFSVQSSFRCFFTGMDTVKYEVVSFKTLGLSKRVEDIIYFSKFFISQYALKNHTAKKHLSDEVVSYFMSYEWPGNLTELKACISRLMIFNKGNSGLNFTTSNISPMLDNEVTQVKISNMSLDELDFDSDKELLENEWKDILLYFSVGRDFKKGMVIEEIVDKYSLSVKEVSIRLSHAQNKALELFDGSIKEVDDFLQSKVA